MSLSGYDNGSVQLATPFPNKRYCGSKLLSLEDRVADSDEDLLFASQRQIIVILLLNEQRLVFSSAVAAEYVPASCNSARVDFESVTLVVLFVP